MQVSVADAMKLEKLVKGINESTLEDQDNDYQLSQAVSSMFDALDVLKDRAGLGDDGWREAA